MDNLSHSVAGLALGEAVQRCLAPEPDDARQALRRRMLLVMSWITSNFPDLDVLLSPLLPSPLGYLLHHRGHTHTLLYAIAQALVLLALAWLLWPAARALLEQSASARRGLAAAVGLGLLLHLAMDSLNFYGIHPFHPFDSRWLFGDMVFILEPLFWVAFGVPMAMTVRRAALRNALLALLAGVLVFSTVKGFLAWWSLLALAGVGAACAALARRPGGGDGGGGARRLPGALLAALLASVVFVGVQNAGSVHGKRIIAAALQADQPRSRVLDIAMSAYPANPLCWMFASVQSDEGAGSYTLRRGRFSLAPQLMPVGACPPGLSEGAAMEPATGSATGTATRPAPGALALLPAQQGSLAALRKLAFDNCHFRAWLRFARMPSVTDTEASDIRFTLSPRGNFTTLRFADLAARACPRAVPEWDFPRADLLAPPGPPAPP